MNEEQNVIEPKFDAVAELKSIYRETRQKDDLRHASDLVLTIMEIEMALEEKKGSK